MSKEALILALKVIASTAVLTYLFSVLSIKYLKVLTSKTKPELSDIQTYREGTPNTGGISFLSSFLITAFIFIPLNLTAKYILFSTFIFAVIGLIDDLAKINTDNGDGLSAKQKAILQFVAAFIVATVGDRLSLTNIGLSFLYKEGMGWAAIRIFLTTFYIAYFVNAFNISDGLDGLLGSITIPIIILMFMILLSIPNHTTVMMLGVGIISGLLVFMYFNSHPASYFMGDCGSMGLGAFMSIMALNLNIVPIFLVATLMLSIELFSSLIQIVSIRKFKRKVFEIAPIHHMYQKRGIRETSIVSQFARYSAIFSIIAFFLYAISKF